MSTKASTIVVLDEVAPVVARVSQRSADLEQATVGVYRARAVRGSDAQRVVDAALESDSSGRWVSL